jgi:esterase/lipase
MTSLSPAKASAFSATEQFYARSTGVKVFRWGLRAAQNLWPALGQRLAKRLFLTPLPPKWLHRRGDWPNPWRREHWPFERASLTLYRYQTAALVVARGEFETHLPHVLLVHGWGGHAGQMLALAQRVAEAGFVPLILEFPAHGRSRGMQSSLPQFARAIDYTATRLADKGVELHGLIAHSLGATAAAWCVARGLGVQRLVLVAPADAPRDYTHMFAQVFGLHEATRAGMQGRIEAQEAATMAQFDAAATAGRVSAHTLVVHDEQDKINHFAGAHRFVSRLPRAELLATQGLGHRKILRDDVVGQAVKRFMQACLSKD